MHAEVKLTHPPRKNNRGRPTNFVTGSGGATYTPPPLSCHGTSSEELTLFGRKYSKCASPKKQGTDARWGGGDGGRPLSPAKTKYCGQVADTGSCYGKVKEATILSSMICLLPLNKNQPFNCRSFARQHIHGRCTVYLPSLFRARASETTKNKNRSKKVRFGADETPAKQLQAATQRSKNI